MSRIRLSEECKAAAKSGSGVCERETKEEKGKRKQEAVELGDVEERGERDPVPRNMGCKKNTRRLCRKLSTRRNSGLSNIFLSKALVSLCM